MKVAEWQQTYYASDSGIQSGATTVRDDEESECSGKKYTVSGTTGVENTSGRTLVSASVSLFFSISSRTLVSSRTLFSGTVGLFFSSTVGLLIQVGLFSQEGLLSQVGLIFEIGLFSQVGLLSEIGFLPQ